MTKVLIVESPTKAKTIRNYLGDGFAVLSSYGHVRDLPKSELGVDVEHDFQPTYVVLPEQKKWVGRLMEELKKLSRKGVEVILLATDPDREGEAIAWHLAELLKDFGVPVRRVEFHEITRPAVRKAIEQPRGLDMNLVNAQQARRILDRLVGYEISPIMWRKVIKGRGKGSAMSAGRVQSVALRLIIEREEEIRRFRPEEYWTVDALLLTPDKGELKVRLVRVGEEEPNLPNRQAVDELIAGLEGKSFRVVKLEEKLISRRPKPPYTTSTLQQEANTRLGFSSRRTMRIAQQLYEGVELEGERTGLITYMRTDSVRVAEEAISQARATIEELAGPQYLPEKPHRYKDKSAATQGAHEAIRPTYANLTPEKVRPYLSEEQFKLYELIWRRFMASQAAPARIRQATVEVEAGGTRWRATASRVEFDGYLRFLPEKKEKKEEVELPQGLREGMELALRELLPEQHFTKPPPRYTDASLVKTLEEYGIGRPSTYAQIIETLLERNYVERKKRSLVPTPLGYAANEFMQKFFPEIVNTGFTASLEEKLDEIEAGRRDWVEILREFYERFLPLKRQAEEAKEVIRVRPLEAPEEYRCPKCGGPMVYRQGRRGVFLSCKRFPECDGALNLDREGKPLPPTNNQGGIPVGRACPKCGGQLLLKTSRYGTEFLGCENYPKCDFVSEPQTACPKCGGELEVVELKNKRKLRVCKDREGCGFSVWGRPRIERCDLCGWWLAERTSRGKRFIFCSNPDCEQHGGVDEEKLEELREKTLAGLAASG